MELNGQGEAGFQPSPGDDDRFMAHALRLARRGINTTHPNPAVGSIVVKNGRVVGEGWHQVAGQPHAEILALRQAGKQARGATLYVTLEPCSHHGRTPPCVKAIVKSGIQRVVVAIADPDPRVNHSGISELKGAGLEVRVGPGRAEAGTINRGFLKRVTTGIPWVTLKMASSLDGKTAMLDGESQWITSEAARRDAHQWRAQSSAIMTGVGTVLRDDPNMTARLDGVQRQPLRVVLDSNLSTPATAKILSNDGNVLIITSVSGDEPVENRVMDSVEVIRCPASRGKVDLHAAMHELGRREMNTVLLEAGPRLSGSMIEQGLVDEVIVYLSPDLLGSRTRGMFDIPGVRHLADRIFLEYRDVVAVGRDLRLTLGVKPR